MIEWDDVVFRIPDGNGGMILPPATTTGTQIVSYDVTWQDNILDANDHFDNVEDAMMVMNSQWYTCIRTRLCDTVVEHNLRQPRPISSLILLCYCLTYNLIRLLSYLFLSLLHGTYICSVNVSSSSILRFCYVTISITRFNVAFRNAQVHPNHTWR